MSGRGGRGRGRGRNTGRGSSNKKGKKSGDSSSTSQKLEMKFAPQTHGKRSGPTYATVKDALIQQVQRTYKNGFDVAKSLKDMKIIDLKAEAPTRTIATTGTDAEKAIAQAGHDIKYQEELRRHLDRADNLKEGLTKAYALIFSNYCTKTMQSRIEEHPEFATKLEDDPIATLEAIKTLMHDTVRAQYPLVSLTESLQRLINVKQQQDEDLLDYVKRFKQLRDIVLTQLGDEFLKKFVENSEEYRNIQPSSTSQADKDALLKEAVPKWMAYLLLKGSDPLKYGTLLRGFTSQFSLGNDQYPKTMRDATDALSQHKIDQAYYDKRNKDRNRDREQSNRERSQQREQPSQATSFAQ